MNAAILLSSSNPVEVSSPTGYIAGGVIALFILAYLLYSLIKPGKF